MVRLEAISKSFGARRLFSDVSWQLPVEGCVGLVGPNGAGKSTLVRIILGQETPDDGEVIVPKGCDVGHLPQEIIEESDQPVIEFVLDGAGRLRRMAEELQELERQLTLATGDALERATAQYTALQERFTLLGGWTLESRAREVLVGLGFTPESILEPLSTFSGGWRMRALLARLLLRQPELLLLDEPTNHLDLESIEWLEGFLSRYEGGVVLISHDRTFLNRVVGQIAELRRDGVKVYRGSYDRFLELRAEDLERQRKLADRQRDEIGRLEDFIDRFRYKATKARQVQSRVKMLEKMDRVSVDDELAEANPFQFIEPERLPRVVIEAADLKKTYGDHTVFSALNIAFGRGDKIALVGPNGAGKSTLMKILAGHILPDAGQVVRQPNVAIAHFAQHAVDQLDLNATLLEEMNRAATVESSSRVRSILGLFGFSGDEVEKRVSVLSGGEKTRLALGKLLLKPAGVLLLDEPTNHLDMSSRHVLEEALRTFGGAVCVISHDRYFLESFVNQVLHIEDGQATTYLGEYEAYRYRRAKDLEAMEAASSDALSQSKSQASADPYAELDDSASRKDQRRRAAELRKLKAVEADPVKKELAKIEATIATTEARYEELEALLADPSTYERGEDDLAQLTREYSQRERELEVLMERWEAAQQRLDAIDARWAEQGI